MLVEFIPGKFGLSPGVTHGVDATKFIPVMFIMPVDRTAFCFGFDDFFIVDDQSFESSADKLSDDTDFFVENPGFKRLDFLSLPRLSLNLQTNYVVVNASIHTKTYCEKKQTRYIIMVCIINKNLISFPSKEFCLPNVEWPNVLRPVIDDDRLPKDDFFILLFYLLKF